MTIDFVKLADFEVLLTVGAAVTVFVPYFLYGVFLDFRRPLNTDEVKVEVKKSGTLRE